MNKRIIGGFGEKIACSFLENNGVKIIEKNYFTKYGEIDLIGLENKTIIFIEVKLRNNYNYGNPFEGITNVKIERLYKTAKYYLSNTEIDYIECRFDVVALILDQKFYKVKWLKELYFN